jgi:hypothetical protein
MAKETVPIFRQPPKYWRDSRFTRGAVVLAIPKEKIELEKPGYP